MTNTRSKSQIREEAKIARRALSEELCAARSELIRSHIESWWNAQNFDHRDSSLFLFAALKGEPDLLPLRKTLQVRDMALPVILDRTRIEFRRYQDQDPFNKGPLGIREPGAHAPVVLPRPGDVILVPALVLSTSGQRIGHGAGYYDRYLAGVQSGATLLGVCFAEALLPEGTWHDDHYDQKVDWIVTEDGISKALRIR